MIPPDSRSIATTAPFLSPRYFAALFWASISKLVNKSDPFRGSKKESYNPSEEEIRLAKKATKNINAVFNEVDVTFTSDGPMIIENNPTPNYIEGQDEGKIKGAVDLVASKIFGLK